MTSSLLPRLHVGSLPRGMPLLFWAYTSKSQSAFAQSPTAHISWYSDHQHNDLHRPALLKLPTHRASKSTQPRCCRQRRGRKQEGPACPKSTQDDEKYSRVRTSLRHSSISHILQVQKALSHARPNKCSLPGHLKTPRAPLMPAPIVGKLEMMRDVGRVPRTWCIAMLRWHA